MTVSYIPQTFAALALLVCTACGATTVDGESGGGGVGGGPTEPTDPPDEVVNVNYDELSDRTAPGTAAMAYVLLNGQTPISNDNVTMVYSNGVITGGVLDATDLDDVRFSNPANGEFSRIVRITGDNLFGAVGLDVLPADLPSAGTVTMYNEGWVGMTASFENNVYVLEGDASFTATWADNDVDGRFFNLSGTDPLNGAVTNVGAIDLNNATISGDNFAGGNVSGTGIFADLDGGSSTAGTQGTFFGPDAEELGGVLLINDAGEDILIVGGFQAD